MFAALFKLKEIHNITQHHECFIQLFIIISSTKTRMILNMNQTYITSPLNMCA